MQPTVSVLIGNSDNRLSQEEWVQFLAEARQGVEAWASTVFIEGHTAPTSRKQSACWVFAIDEIRLPKLRRYLQAVRKTYRQDSIAMVVGKSELLTAKEG